MTKKRNISSRAKSFFKTMIILALVLTLIIVVDIRIRPMIRSMAESQARSIATLAINEAVSEVMSEENVGYDDLISIEKDENGRVTAVKTNIVRMNSLKSKITTRISEKKKKVKKKRNISAVRFSIGRRLAFRQRAEHKIISDIVRKCDNNYFKQI